MSLSTFDDEDTDPTLPMPTSVREEVARKLADLRDSASDLTISDRLIKVVEASK